MTPPSAEAAVDILGALPNGTDWVLYPRDYYRDVMIAAAGCIRALGDDPNGIIAAAAIDFAARGGGDIEDEEDKWTDDWSRRGGKAGWHSLVNECRRRNPDHPTLAGYLTDLRASQMSSPEDDFADVLLDPVTPEQKAEAERQTREAPATLEHPKPGALGDIGTLAWWERRTLTEPTRLLGSFITLPSKVWLSGQTGLGKSMFAMGAAIGIASGAGFLHWTCERPARVLYLDGEMGARAVRARLLRAAQERGEEIGDRLRVFSPDDMDYLARRLGQQNAPLNTEAGRRFVIALADHFEAEVIIIDNFMAFCAGNLKDTEVWQQTKPLVDRWHVQGKAQLWLDHTIRDGSRQYGDTTKKWGFETAAVLLALGKVVPDEIHATLTFAAEHEGKHRHRVAANWDDFADHDIHLENGTWRSVAREATKMRNPEAKAVAPERRAKSMHELLLATFGGDPVRRQEWFEACEVAGILSTPTTVPHTDDDEEEETKKTKKRQQAFRHGVHNLQHCKWVQSLPGDMFRDCRNGAPEITLDPDDGDGGPTMNSLMRAE